MAHNKKIKLLYITAQHSFSGEVTMMSMIMTFGVFILFSPPLLKKLFFSLFLSFFLQFSLSSVQLSFLDINKE
jgi:hypothetical protein